MASPAATPPARHLLRQATGLLRRRPSPAPRFLLLLLRRSSSATKPPPKVLAKPERFTPPSHGSRLPRKTPRHYGGDLSAEEKAAQEVREYPGMPPAPGSQAHRILHSRWIHVVITVGTLTSLAIYTFVLNFQRTSPFADLLPAASDFVSHPILSARALADVIRMHETHKAERIAEKRAREVEDVAKRRLYRRAHGLPDEVGLFNQSLAKTKAEAEAAAAAADDNSPVNAAAEAAAAAAAAQGETVVGNAEAPHAHGARRLSEQEQKEAVDKVKNKRFGIF
ncbi:hypothetical protein VTJ83DRAFT_6544 [Remersonia thermophila]|uniref:Uncharacterized protein n=1 Tax=Remersonia thermophila TaxID=72144 RepID=A0ABR4D5Y2_9PEZI